MPLMDKFGRSIHDLRISITDRCNYRCVYCRTGNQGAQFAELALGGLPAHGASLCLAGHHQDSPDRRRASAAARHHRTGARTGRPAHRRGSRSGTGHHHQRAFAGGDGRAAEAGGAGPRDGEHGRRGSRSALPASRGCKMVMPRCWRAAGGAASVGLARSR